MDLGKVCGLVAGNFGEVSDHWHQLLAALATSRVQVAGVQRECRGLLRNEDAEFATAISSLRVSHCKGSVHFNAGLAGGDGTWGWGS